MQFLSPNQAPDALCRAVHQMLCTKPRVLIAIDGMAASGKTTLAADLSARLADAYVVHMDDFFLEPEKRFGDYYETHLANADIERFYAEVLDPLSRGEGSRYRPYLAHPEPMYLPPVTIPSDWRTVIIEGAYSLHPALSALYDLRVLQCIGAKTQRARILARNGEQMLTPFLTRFIPMENRHLSVHQVEACADFKVMTP